MTLHQQLLAAGSFEGPAAIIDRVVDAIRFARRAYTDDLMVDDDGHTGHQVTLRLYEGEVHVHQGMSGGQGYCQPVWVAVSDTEADIRERARFRLELLLEQAFRYGIRKGMA